MMIFRVKSILGNLHKPFCCRIPRILLVASPKLCWLYQLTLWLSNTAIGSYNSERDTDSQLEIVIYNLGLSIARVDNLLASPAASLCQSFS